MWDRVAEFNCTICRVEIDHVPAMFYGWPHTGLWASHTDTAEDHMTSSVLVPWRLRT